MKVFITGGTGFIGSRVLKKLVERGDEVYALARSGSSAAEIEAMGAHVVSGDLDNLEVLRAGMQGCDVVFHIAAWYKLGGNDPEKMYRVNVGGTQNVLQTAFEAGVPKIVYTSSLAVNGDTHGQIVDETFRQGAPFLTDYDRSKWRAHYEVALPLIEKGAPIVIVMPGAVFGPGDRSLVGETLRWFQRGWLPVVPGPETTLAYTYVDDIAEGHILAADKGKPGESYILTGPVLRMVEWLALVASVLGKSAPRITIPAAWLTPLAPAIGALEKVLPLPALFCRDSIAILGASYAAKADKARDELGWTPRALRDGLQLTLQAQADAQRTAAPNPETERRKQVTLTVLVMMLAVVLLWIKQWFKPRKRRS
ncbi:MAG: NAD-dependent epimerase/dehydratase family protein [Anaerolineae bacterium]|nr:NAD-dependent epimerase/dehydratase family protein [Anaerolineae bacterium]